MPNAWNASPDPESIFMICAKDMFQLKLPNMQGLFARDSFQNTLSSEQIDLQVIDSFTKHFEGLTKQQVIDLQSLLVIYHHLIDFDQKSIL